MDDKQIKALLTIGLLVAALIFGLSSDASPMAEMQDGSVIVRQRPTGKISAELHVDRGLVLSKHPAAHDISLQTWERVGLPSFDKLPSETRLELAIKEFRLALAQAGDLGGYVPGQVHSFLGRAWMSLGLELQRQAEHSRGNQIFKHRMKKAFESSINEYRLAVQQEPETLRYYAGEDLVQSVIASGDLNRALAVIDQLDRTHLRPNASVDHGLIRMRADIFWIMGRYNESGASYEEWIRRGETESALSAPSLVYERLAYLKKQTGHPDNLPSKAALGGR